MRAVYRSFAAGIFVLSFAGVAGAAQVQAPLTAETINMSDLSAVLTAPDGKRGSAPAIVKLQVLLDRLGASPAVIDGFDGDNVRKAIGAYQAMHGTETGGRISAELIATFQSDDPVMGDYTISDDDVSKIGPPIPSDYAEMAKLKFLGYSSVSEELAERFQMDEDLLKALNPDAKWAAGEIIAVAEPGEGEVATIEADKEARQLRAYDADGKLLVAYPAEELATLVKPGVPVKFTS